MSVEWARDPGALRLRGKAILVGSALEVRLALTALAKSELDVMGVALVGGGDAEGPPLLARAPAWDALDFESLGGSYLVVAGPHPAPALARIIVRKAAAARLRVATLDPEGARLLTINDLVGRPLESVDWQGIRARIAGRRVLITGGGGTIGGELARRVASLAPERLTLLDSSEHNLYAMSHELPSIGLALADVRDARSVRRWMARERPQIVFHAAALKQVPLAETFTSENVLTNVCGLRNVADACQEIGAQLVFVSTDKAVDPSGVMGAAKRLGELYCQALDRAASGRAPRALPVRLGNVIGSAGSVLPLFERQLARGEPLTVTDAEMTRYFLSIPQAADFLLQAAAIGIGTGEGRGAAFVIDMGEAIPVVELARKVIRLAGQRPELDVPIRFVGLRPGEKLHEQLVARDEWREPDPAPGVIAAGSAPRGLADLRERIARLEMLAGEGADAAVAEELFAAIAPARSEDRSAPRATG